MTSVDAPRPLLPTATAVPTVSSEQASTSRTQTQTRRSIPAKRREPPAAPAAAARRKPNQALVARPPTSTSASTSLSRTAPKEISVAVDAPVDASVVDSAVDIDLDVDVAMGALANLDDPVPVAVPVPVAAVQAPSSKAVNGIVNAAAAAVGSGNAAANAGTTTTQASRPPLVAIVTGSSSGIGRAVALGLHADGAVLLCVDLRPSAPGLTSTHSEIIKAGGRAEFVRADVTVARDVENAVARCVELYGRVDIMINNAGIAHETHNPQPVWSYSEEMWDATFDVNTKGVFLGCKYAAAQMIKQDPHPSGDRGWIVNVASIVGLKGVPQNSGYCASKHAVVGLTKVVALDCAEHRIHCNAVCPGYTETAMTSGLLTRPDIRAYIAQKHPFRGIGQPDDIAKVILFLSSEKNTWITGMAIPVDGGYTSM